MPGIGHNPKFTDGNVALFAGGNYTVDGGSAEAEGLLALMLLTAARFPSRLDEQGALLRLDDQDRAKWNMAMI